MRAARALRAARSLRAARVYTKEHTNRQKHNMHFDNILNACVVHAILHVLCTMYCIRCAHVLLG